jgi:hypothetical protein
MVHPMNDYLLALSLAFRTSWTWTVGQWKKVF